MMDSLYEDRSREDMKLLKRNMTLDFNSPTNPNKKIKFMKTCILESPDLKMLKLGSPELERMIIAQNGLVTTTPTPGLLPHYFLKSEETEVTEEQEQYARGFVEALNQLHQTNGYNDRQNPNQQNNNNINNHQNNSHQQNNNQLINNNNNNNHQLSSDSSSDLTIAEHNSSNSNNSINKVNGSNGYNNSNNNSNNNFSQLIPNSVPTATTTVTTFAANKFLMPSIPAPEQYVNLNNSNGGEVIINSSSVLPPYSAAVNNNAIYPMTIKVEPIQKPSTHPSLSTTTTTSGTGLTPPLSPQQQQQHMAPIDMADQERIKLERKRLRNRIAASKCRRRKLERISRLEDKVKGLKGENSELSVVVNKLRDQVCSLKQQVMDHVKCGCQLLPPQ
jgi:hypothetical protein